MAMKYYKIGDVPFATNAVPAKGAVEIDKVEHDRLARASIRPEPVFGSAEDPLEKRIKALEDTVLALKEIKV